jgi:hypothetical protein
LGEARGASNRTHGLEPQCDRQIINACLRTSLLRFMAWIENLASVGGLVTKTEKPKINERECCEISAFACHKAAKRLSRARVPSIASMTLAFRAPPPAQLGGKAPSEVGPLFRCSPFLTLGFHAAGSNPRRPFTAITSRTCGRSLHSRIRVRDFALRQSRQVATLSARERP